MTWFLMHQDVIQMASPELPAHAVPLQTYYYFPIISFVVLVYLMDSS